MNGCFLQMVAATSQTMLTESSSTIISLIIESAATPPIIMEWVGSIASLFVSILILVTPSFRTIFTSYAKVKQEEMKSVRSYCILRRA